MGFYKTVKQTWWIWTLVLIFCLSFWVFVKENYKSPPSNWDAGDRVRLVDSEQKGVIVDKWFSGWPRVSKHRRSSGPPPMFYKSWQYNVRIGMDKRWFAEFELEKISDK